MATNFNVKIVEIGLFNNVIHHPGIWETDCNIAILIFESSSVMIWLYFM